VTAGSGSVWVTDASNGTVSRIDPATGAQVDRITVGGEPASITSGAGAMVANANGATVLRIDPPTGMVTQTIPLGGANPVALTFGAGRLWVADSTTRMLYKLDPSTGDLLPSIPLEVSRRRSRSVEDGCGLRAMTARRSCRSIRPRAGSSASCTSEMDRARWRSPPAICG
jgi:YVTN family beta-propeller protein